MNNKDASFLTFTNANEYQHQVVKNNNKMYNFPINQNMNSHARLKHIKVKPENTPPSQLFVNTSEIDFEIKKQNCGFLFDKFNLVFNIKNNHASNVATICNAPHLIQSIEILKGANSIGTPIQSHAIWLNNILENGNADTHLLNDFSLWNANINQLYTIGPQIKKNVIIDLPLPFKNTLVLRDLINYDITIRIKFRSSNIVDNAAVSNSYLLVDDLHIVMSGYELPNHDVFSIRKELASTKILDYRCSILDYQKYDLGVGGVSIGDSFNIRLTNINSFVSGIFFWLNHTIEYFGGHNKHYKMDTIELINSSETNINNFTFGHDFVKYYNSKYLFKNNLLEWYNIYNISFSTDPKNTINFGDVKGLQNLKNNEDYNLKFKAGETVASQLSLNVVYIRPAYIRITSEDKSYEILKA